MGENSIAPVAPPKWVVWMMVLCNQSTKVQIREMDRKPQSSKAGLKGRGSDSIVAAKKSQTQKVVPLVCYSQ